MFQRWLVAIALVAMAVQVCTTEVQMMDGAGACRHGAPGWYLGAHKMDTVLAMWARLW